MEKLFKNARILSPDFSIIEGSIFVTGEKISAIYKKGEEPSTKIEHVVDLDGKIAFPALINSHDHLYDTYWPPFADLKFNNWYDWEQAYQDTENFKLKQKLSAADMYALGMFKNVFNATCLVVDHFPSDIAATFYNKSLISLLNHFFLAHSASTKAPEWGAGLKEEFRRSRGVLPFILHVEEGFDSEVSQEVETLHRVGVLADNTVLVNGVGLSSSDLEMIASKNASVVWCPVSNTTVFGKDTPVEKILDMGIRCSIGTDCTLKGSGGLFDDIRRAREVLSSMNLKTNPDQAVIQMVTSSPADIFKIKSERGVLSEGKYADLLIFEDTDSNPFESFFNLSPSKISLFLHKGSLVYGNEDYRSLCLLDFEYYSEISVEGRPKIIWGHPMQLLSRINHKLGQEVSFPFFPVSD
ncbi:MAG: amidohydrolase family protein [Candidatus Riflebacteria bacterium]|nr:amidohydrolase family protein [Candidatus Riflebacteria bacterium]